MTLPPYITQAADTFEATLRTRAALENIDWLSEHCDFQSLRKIQERLEEIVSRGEAA